MTWPDPSHTYNGDPVRVVDGRAGWVSVNTNYNPEPAPNSEPEYRDDARPQYFGARHVYVGTGKLILVEVKVGDRWVRRPLSRDLLKVVDDE